MLDLKQGCVFFFKLCHTKIMITGITSCILSRLKLVFELLLSNWITMYMYLVYHKLPFNLLGIIKLIIILYVVPNRLFETIFGSFMYSNDFYFIQR